MEKNSVQKEREHPPLSEALERIAQTNEVALGKSPIPGLLPWIDTGANESINAV